MALVAAVGKSSSPSIAKGTRCCKAWRWASFVIFASSATLIVLYNSSRVVRSFPPTQGRDAPLGGVDAPSPFGEKSFGSDNKENKERSSSYSMRQYSFYNLTFAINNRCTVGVTRNKFGRKPYKRVPLLETLQPLLNFTTHVHASQNVLVLGDSVAIQFGQLLEEALGSDPASREVLQYSWRGNEGVTISTTKGGGASALYRITGMFLPEGEGKPLPNEPGGGWNRSHVTDLLKHPHLKRNGGTFDVLIFRIPHGWLTFEEITQETLQQSIQLAHEVFGVTKVILIDIPLTNNIITDQDLQDKTTANEMMQSVAAMYPLSNGKNKVDQVTVLQFARWTDDLMEFNARAIGLLPNDNVVVQNKSYALQRLGCSKHFPLSIAQGCAEFAKSGDCRCYRNRITQDGMHWCLESLGGRLMAGIACLVSCMEQLQSQTLRDCETRCNDQFMSLRVPGPEMFEEG